MRRTADYRRATLSDDFLMSVADLMTPRLLLMRCKASILLFGWAGIRTLGSG